MKPGNWKFNEKLEPFLVRIQRVELCLEILLKEDQGAVSI